MNRHDPVQSYRLPSPITLVVAALGIVGASLILIVGAKFGLGTSNDGVLYLSAARNLLQGAGLVDFQGSPLVIFPPLFSILLAILGLGASTVETAARVLQTLLYAGNFTLAAILLVRIVRDRTWVLMGILLFLASRTFLLYHFYVLSEPLFVALTLWMLLLLCKWRNGARPSLLLWAAVLAGLSCLTRYAGVANVLVGSTIVFLSDDKLRHRIGHAVGFAAISLAPLLAWLFRNAAIGGSLTGNRLPSPYPVLLNLRHVADGLALWFVPDEVPEWIRLAFVVVGAFAILIVFWRTARHEKGMAQASGRTVLLLATAFHILVPIVATSIFASDYISTRLVMPAYIPVVVLIVATVAWTYEHVRRSRPLLVVGILGWMAIQGFTGIRLVADRYQHGVGGYATAAWTESDVIAFARNNPDSLGTDAFSNAALGLYHHTGLAVNLLPDRLNPRWAADYPTEALGARATMEDVHVLVNSPGRTVTLIWFNIAGQDPKYESIYLFNQYQLNEIEQLFLLRPVFEGGDGGVYQLSARLVVR